MMSQAEFDEFMAAQCAAVEASGLAPDEWVEAYAEAFRAQWEASHGVAA